MVVQLDDIINETLIKEVELVDEIESKIDKDLARVGGEKLLNEGRIIVSFGQDVNRRVADELREKYQECNDSYIITHKYIDKNLDASLYSGLSITKR